MAKRINTFSCIVKGDTVEAFFFPQSLQHAQSGNVQLGGEAKVIEVRRGIIGRSNPKVLVRFTEGPKKGKYFWFEETPNGLKVVWGSSSRKEIGARVGNFNNASTFQKVVSY
jgi:hypothetical protein